MKREIVLAILCLTMFIGCEKPSNVNTVDTNPAVSSDIHSDNPAETKDTPAPNDNTNDLNIQNTEQDKTPAPPQVQPKETVVATNADTPQKSDTEAQNCPDPDVLYYEDAYTVFGEDVESTYGTECNDGKSYCYGMDNDPILIPQDPSGWGCRHVVSMPGDKKFKHEYMYFENIKSPQIMYYDDMHRVNRKYINWGFMQAWVCETEDGCPCGGMTCPTNTLCIDEKCYCNDKPYKSGKCTLEQPKLKGQNGGDYYDDNEDNDYEDNGNLPENTTSKPRRDEKGKIIEGEYDLYCGGTKMTESNSCILLSDGRKAILFRASELKGEDYYPRPDCKAEEDDDCSTNVRSIAAERKRRINDPDFKCGQETCVYDEICLNNHCVGLGTLKPLPSNAYTWDNYLPKCIEKNGCKCGSSQCKQNEFCTDSGCTDYPYRKKIKGKWVRFANVLTEYHHLNEGDEIDEIEVRNGFEMPSQTIWFDILTNKDSAACDNFTMPDNVEDYVCVFDGRENGCGEGPQMYISSAGYFCNNPEGCLCGNTKIPLYAGCRLGKVNYDAVYQTLACNHEMNDYLSRDIAAVSKLVDEKGWCICGVSTVPPNMKGYRCDATAMICKQKSGCECGSAKCEFLEACVKPGECRKI